MGSRVAFVRAPRGDATQAPPPIGPASQLGTSGRAAREDHTHEGVHKLVAGSGIALDPASGLGDVKVEALHWRPPVATAADLPTTGNQDGDARVVLNEAAIYIWSAATSAWQKVSGGTSGGGSGGGFVLDERLNHLRGQIRVSQLHASSRFDLYSEFVDDFNDDTGINKNPSSGYVIENSRLKTADTGGWTRLTTSPTPSARNQHNMVYDSHRKVIVLFGGSYGPDASQNLNDTWEWDGTTWVQRTPITRPQARINHAMAYDVRRRVVVLFGGFVYGMGHVNDTWEWDGVNWTQKSPVDKPPATAYAAMAYDTERGVTVLLLNGQTWIWDGLNWRRVYPSTQPTVYPGRCMVYDSRRKVIVAYLNGQTWEWDGQNWILKTPNVTPDVSNSTYAAMAYHEALGVCVLFGGGNSATNNVGNDTWEWDGFEWVKKTYTTKPTARRMHALSYDAERGNVVLFGGYDGTNRLADTWKYAQAGAAQVFLNPLSLPWVPSRAYLTAQAAGAQFYVSRDGGQTFSPISSDGEIDLVSQPSGTNLVTRIVLTAGGYVDAIGVGAANI